MRIAYFTAGNVGAGHHVRGLAIGRGLARAGFRGEYVSVGPPLVHGGAPAGEHRAVTVSHEDLADARRAPESDLARVLSDVAPDLLLVDLFWAPLLHLRVPCETWLLVRACPPVWFVGPTPAVRFDPSRFARVFAIEPHLAHVPATDVIEPVVVANPDERRPRGALRERLGVASDARLEVVMHAGRRGEREALVAGRPGSVVLDLFDDDALFPAAEWLGDADAVTCAAGYNAFWESRWLGTFARTTFTPLPRLIDDQARRLRACSDHVVKENGADALARAILGR
jgi:hypothetical protein